MPLNRTQRKTVRRPSGRRMPIRMLIRTGFPEVLRSNPQPPLLLLQARSLLQPLHERKQCPLHARDRVVCVTLAPMTETGIDFVRTNTAAIEGCGAVIWCDGLK